MLSNRLIEYAEKKYAERLPYLETVRAGLEEGFSRCTPEEAALMRFFYGTMPLRDAGEYDFRVFLSFVRHGLWLREHVAWCAALPEDIFVNHVLYYRINSEDISENRAFFYEQLKDRLTGKELWKSPRQAVIEINYWCAEHATYQASDMRTASPMTVYRSGKGRCGEESTFMVTALRSVGIPARQVYTPRWAHCDDNHAWVEVWAEGRWYFLGACEPEEVLNKGWFSHASSRALLVKQKFFIFTLMKRWRTGRMADLVYNIVHARTRTRWRYDQRKGGKGRAGF
ncbi:MAG: transglutaminase-like domain-containing protein [Eisenbergiella massiliensis]